jgi:hypothetical protein
MGPSLAQDDDMVEALAPDRSVQPFGEAKSALASDKYDYRRQIYRDLPFDQNAQATQCSLERAPALTGNGGKAMWPDGQQ